MEFAEFRQLFITVFGNVTTNPSVITIESSADFELLSPEDIEWTLEEIERSYGTKIPQDMSQLIFPDNTILCWHYNLRGQKHTGGEFNFRSTFGQFVDTTKTDFADTITEYEQKLYRQGYRFFDSHPHAGDGMMAALKIEKNTVKGNIILVDVVHEDMWELDLNYPGYIDHTLKLKGLYEWQYLFMDVDFRGLDFDIALLRKRLEDYPKIFEGEDVSEYLKRYNDRHGY